MKVSLDISSDPIDAGSPFQIVITSDRDLRGDVSVVVGEEHRAFRFFSFDEPATEHSVSVHDHIPQIRRVNGWGEAASGETVRVTFRYDGGEAVDTAIVA